MKRERIAHPAALGCIGVALLAAGWLVVSASSRDMDPGAARGVSEAAQDSPTPAASAGPERILRASLAMPYFSFARRLRPRS
jgi:hypothetical protein